MKLTKSHLDFLETQKISLSRVFDASGMHKKDYQSVMSELEMLVAYGVTPCQKYGHTLRTRAGHCAQCNTAALAFLSRHDEEGDVYVAHSSNESITKIGVASSYIARLRSLNSIGYGGIRDWEIAFTIRVSKAGLIEYRAQKSLRDWRISKSYNKSGQLVSCLELFRCDKNMAISAVEKAAKDYQSKNR